MDSAFDICVDYDTLFELHHKLELIMNDLGDSANQMTVALQKSEGFLSGHQFEKAKQTTATCVNLTIKSSTNIRYAMKYLEKLMDVLGNYEQCVYRG